MLFRSDKKERTPVLERLAATTCTTIFYEAPHRLKKTLSLLAEAAGAGRKMAVVRELTKKHESVLQMTIGEALLYYEDNEPKGEFVLVLDGADEKEQKRQEQEQWKKMSLEEHMDVYMEQGMAKKEAMKAVAKDRGVSKRDIYAQLLK